MSDHWRFTRRQILSVWRSLQLDSSSNNNKSVSLPRNLLEGSYIRRSDDTMIFLYYYMVQQQLAKVSVGGLLHATFVVHPLSLAYLSSTDWPFANRYLVHIYFGSFLDFTCCYPVAKYSNIKPHNWTYHIRSADHPKTVRRTGQTIKRLPFSHRQQTACLIPIVKPNKSLTPGHQSHCQICIFNFWLHLST